MTKRQSIIAVIVMPGANMFASTGVFAQDFSQIAKQFNLLLY
jgi:hypothetical protein